MKIDWEGLAWFVFIVCIGLLFSGSTIISIIKVIKGVN